MTLRVLFLKGEGIVRTRFFTACERKKHYHGAAIAPGRGDTPTASGTTVVRPLRPKQEVILHGTGQPMSYGNNLLVVLVHGKG